MITTILALSAVSAFADSYQCKITISNAGQTVGTMKLEQEATGTTVSNRLYTLPVSKKKNVFGKTVKEVEIVMAGAIMATRDPYEGALKGEIAVATTIETRKKIHTDYKSIAKIDSTNDFDINTSGSGYTATGGCKYVR